jgi:hypothetical protein
MGKQRLIRRSALAFINVSNGSMLTERTSSSTVSVRQEPLTMVVDIVVSLVVIPVTLAALVAKTMAHLKGDNRDSRSGRATGTYGWLLLFQLVSTRI